MQQLNHVWKLGAHPLLPPSEQLNLAVGRAMGLQPHPVVLVFGHALPAQPGEDLAGLRQPLGQHHSHRVASPYPQLLDSG
jgi:hypothetical protein